MNDLKTCPFCGSDAVVTYAYDRGYQVYCENENCILNDLVMYDKETEQEAIEAWNWRVSE